MRLLLRGFPIRTSLSVLNRGFRDVSGRACSSTPAVRRARTDPLPEKIVQDLQKIAGSSSVSVGLAVREQYSKDESYHHEADGIFPPQVVVFPKNTEMVSEIVKMCAQTKTPIVPSGACTSLEGHIAAVQGGVAINMRDMNRIVEVNTSDLDCRVEAGVTRKQLNEYLRDTGLFFPVDPGADASLGGMASTRASGTNAVRYGTMRHNVLGLTAVLADGRVVKTGGRAPKSAAGYDLTGLLVGSEGTLAVITEVALRLYGQPEATCAAVCAFDDLRGAVDACISIMQMGVPVARIEVLDEAACAAVNRYSHTTLAERATLFFEFHGTAAAVEEQARLARDVTSQYGGAEFQWAHSPDERARLWSARHNAYYATLALRPGCKGMPTDACVPISRLADCILETHDDLRRSRLTATLVGHVGDGNFHMILVLDPNDSDELHRAIDFAARLAHRAIGMGGTCTGEHGIGYGKLRFMEEEHGAAAVAAMRAIKTALDPLGIMNPGKMGSH